MRAVPKMANDKKKKQLNDVSVRCAGMYGICRSSSCHKRVYMYIYALCDCSQGTIYFSCYCVNQVITLSANTLSTCHGYHFVGFVSIRFIVGMAAAGLSLEIWHYALHFRFKRCSTGVSSMSHIDFRMALQAFYLIAMA